MVILPKIRSIARSISSRTPPSTFPMFRPTGHRGFGLCLWSEKTPGDSTVRYTSRSVICSGLRARRDPPPAPVWETTRCPCARSHNILLITTGFVLTLPAISSDFREWSSEHAIMVKRWVAIANRLLLDIQGSVTIIVTNYKDVKHYLRVAL